MNRNLTLRLDADLVERAKRHSAKSGKSVSRLVADYFSLLDSSKANDGNVTSRVSALRGSLSAADLDECDYVHHSEEKHG